MSDNAYAGEREMKQSDGAGGNAAGGGGGWFAMLKSAFWDFIADDAITQAAAVAFYTALSFAPLLLLMMVLFGKLDEIAGTGTQDRVVGEVQSLIGGKAAEVVQDVQQQQEQKEQEGPTLLSLTGIISILVLIWSASGVFAQLQAALNAIWDVEQAPGQGVWGWLRARGLSVAVVFAILFILLASLVVTAVLNAVMGGGGGGEGEDVSVIWQVINFVVSFVIYVGLFALIFKFLPDVKIPWRTVWIGAIVTSVLFTVGKFLIGLYLGTSDPGSAYGGAGGVVVLLVWVYYSAIIVFLGAEITQAWAKQKNIHIEPSKHARPAMSHKEEPANEAAVDRMAKERSGARM